MRITHHPSHTRHPRGVVDVWSENLGDLAATAPATTLLNRSPRTSPGSADEADRRQLHCEAQPVVIAAATTYESQIDRDRRGASEVFAEIGFMRNARPPAVPRGVRCGRRLVDIWLTRA
jgi:hypothetical protein